MRIEVGAEFERVIKQMEWGEVLDTVQAVVENMLGGTPNPPPTTPPPSPPLTDEAGYDINPQAVDSQYVSGGCSSHHLGTAPHSFAQPPMLGGTPNPPPTTPPPSPPLTDELGYYIDPQPIDSLYVSGGCSSHYLGTAPHSFAQPPMAPQNILQPGDLRTAPHSFAQPPMAPQNILQPGDLRTAPHSFAQPQMAPQNILQPGQLYCQPGVHSQGQHMFYQLPVADQPGTSAAAYHPAAPPHIYNNAPVISFYESTGQDLVPLRLVNGEVLYTIQADTLHHCNSAAPPAPTTKPKKRKREDDNRPYIKKPLNAFMLFMKEQRPKVVAELNIRNNAMVISILGQRWASLSKEEQAQYYKQAEEEKLLHSQQNPGWSSSDNYGIKRKRKRCRASTAAESSASKSEEVKQKTQQTTVMEASTAHTVLETPHTLHPRQLWRHTPLHQPPLPSPPL